MSPSTPEKKLNFLEKNALFLLNGWEVPFLARKRLLISRYKALPLSHSWSISPPCKGLGNFWLMASRLAHPGLLYI